MFVSTSTMHNEVTVTAGSLISLKLHKSKGGQTTHVLIIPLVILFFPSTMVTKNLARTSSSRPWKRSWKLVLTAVVVLQLLISLGVWKGGAATKNSTKTMTAEAMRLDFGLPGGSRVSYRDGLLRIQPPVPTEPSSSSSSGIPQTFEVPWDQALASNTKGEQGIAIAHRETLSKGFGAFYAGTEPLRGGSFLGFYEGRLSTSRESLDRLHALRKKDLCSADMEDDANKVGDYVLSLDGGVHFLDGFDLRYRGNGDEGDDDSGNNERQQFTPAHLNHANKADPACNVMRKLVYLPDDLGLPDIPETNESNNDNQPFWLSQDDYPRNLPRVAFFAARDIPTGEELAFDYGTNFWKTGEQ